MSSPREAAVLHLAEMARRQSDALIVLGVLPGGRFFYSVDDHLALPDLQCALEEIIDPLIASVSRARGRKAKETNEA